MLQAESLTLEEIMDRLQDEDIPAVTSAELERLLNVWGASLGVCVSRKI